MAVRGVFRGFHISVAQRQLKAATGGSRLYGTAFVSY